MLEQLRQWVQPPQPESGVPFDVPCSCGGRVQGYRRNHSQTPRCAKCGELVFVFGLSPYPNASSEGQPLHSSQQTNSRLLTKLLLASGLGSLAVMIGLFFVFRGYLSRPIQQKEVPVDTRRTDSLHKIDGRIEKGKAALAEGSFHLALERFNEALALREELTEPLPSEQARELNQLQRQSALLAEVLAIPLEEVLQQAEDAPSEEAWQARFQRVFHGQSVVFDDFVALDAFDRPLLVDEGKVQLGIVEARVEIGDLELVKNLPLRPTQRWIFGARLASLKQEAGATWVFRFEPKSGVLLTYADAVKAWKPALKMDENIDLVLERQAATLTMLPTPMPVPR